MFVCRKKKHPCKLIFLSSSGNSITDVQFMFRREVFDIYKQSLHSRGKTMFGPDSKFFFNYCTHDKRVLKLEKRKIHFSYYPRPQKNEMAGREEGGEAPTCGCECCPPPFTSDCSTGYLQCPQCLDEICISCLCSLLFCPPPSSHG